MPKFSDEETKPEVVLTGRSREATIDVWDEHRRRWLFSVIGAELRNDTGRGRWEIVGRHENGTDFEHDSASVFRLEGSGLVYDSNLYSSMFFKGVALKGRWYDSDDVIYVGAEMAHSQDDPAVQVCDSEYYHPEGAGWPMGHLVMPYQPPERPFKAQPVEIIVSWTRFLPERD